MFLFLKEQANIYTITISSSLGQPNKTLYLKKFTNHSSGNTATGQITMNDKYMLKQYSRSDRGSCCIVKYLYMTAFCWPQDRQTPMFTWKPFQSHSISSITNSNYIKIPNITFGLLDSKLYETKCCIYATLFSHKHMCMFFTQYTGVPFILIN